jgi:sialate O-acetylesterase
VQLPNNGPAVQTTPPEANPEAAKWAALREAQAKTLRVPNTGMAVTIDTSNGDLHPKNKQPVGDRLSRLALNMVYGKNVACDGPAFAGVSIDGSVAKLKFEHTEGGLVSANGGPLQGFAIAGADRKFVWADAKIEGDEVVVSSPQVTEPVAVRYGWADNPLISLTTREGLPASPFRTDDWK